MQGQKCLRSIHIDNQLFFYNKVINRLENTILDGRGVGWLGGQLGDEIRTKSAQLGLGFV